MTSLLITLLPTYVQAAPDPVPWVEDTDPSHYDMEDLSSSGGVTDTLVKEYKGTETNLRLPAQLNGKMVVLQPGFKLSDAVKNLNISKVKPKDAASIKNLFAGCPKVSKIFFKDVSGTFDTSAVTDMSGLFKGCTALTSVDIGSLNTQAVTDMSGLFEGCENLSELDLSNLNTQAVTNMSGMFKGCKLLQTLTFGDSFNTTQVTDIQEMFQGCESLQSLDLSAFDLGALDQSKVADFLNGVTAPRILSPKKNLLEDKIALPVSGNEYYSDEHAHQNARFLPKTDNGSHTLQKKTGINTVTTVTEPLVQEMYLGDTLPLIVEKGPGNATDQLKWEVLGSDNNPLHTPTDSFEIATNPDTNCKLTAKKEGTYYVRVKPSIDYSWLSQSDQENLKKTWKVTVKQGYRAEVTDDRSDLSPEAKNTAKGFSEEGKYNIQISDNAAKLMQAVESGQNYKNAYMPRYFTLKLVKTTAPAFDPNNYKPIKVTLPIPQSMKSLIAKGKDPELLSLRGSSIYPVNYQFDRDKSFVTFEVSQEDLQQNLEAQYVLIYKTNPDGSANGSSGSSNSASGTSGAIIVNVSPTPITVNVQAGSSSSANSSNSSSNGSSNGSVIIYQNPNGINGGNVIRTLGGGGINGMDMPKTADSMSIRYRTLGAMIMALLGALLFLSSFLVGGFAGRQPELAVSRESRQKRRFEADEDSRWLE
ncbi:MAG: BspA family leucine-rich repeat surface protein [Lachnospiraceae bacterium]|nr:BspA family leucine-rich repeat surface protein [Lachnospiraceae bacterium]